VLADRLPLNDAMRAGAETRGLSTVLVGEHEPVEALIANVPVGDHTITLLPAGPTAPRPGELWASDRAARLFDDLANDFDYVIVDTPPLNGYTDGVIVSALCDGALVLARVRSTTTAALRRAFRALEAANVQVLGTAVTFEKVGALAMRRHRKQRERQTTTDREASSSGTEPAAPQASRRRRDSEHSKTAPVPAGPLVDSTSSDSSAKARGGSR
jgi:MinD-like ATPase involved in chromosome partitioning or flagellar assembly